MQNDKLYVNNKIYVFNDLQGKVKEFCLNPSHLQKEITESFKTIKKANTIRKNYLTIFKFYIF